MKADGWVDEERLALGLGLTRERLAEVRPTDARKNGRAVQVPVSAVETMCAMLGLGKAVARRALKEVAAEGVGEKEAGAGQGEAVLRVLRLTRNERIVMAEKKEAPDGELRVRVHSNVNFVPGMELTGKHVQQDLWDLVGRCPRRRGMW
jgi:hypothetical protein